MRCTHLRYGASVLRSDGTLHGTAAGYGTIRGVLRAQDAKRSTDLRYGATGQWRTGRHVTANARCPTLSAYAFAMRCPILTSRIVLCVYALSYQLSGTDVTHAAIFYARAMKCPVLTSREPGAS
eukprot:1158853-Rhodomonas_salina.2